MLDHLLIIDDDTRIRELLKKYLMRQGFLVNSAENTEKARLLMKQYIFDLLIVDNMMPNENGIDFIQSLRDNNNYVPSLMLTALGEVEDKIKGLSIGADDYVTKPFNPEELVLRINNIIKRTKNNSFVAEKENIIFGNFVFNFKKNELQKNSSVVNLSPVEIKILKVFLSKINIVLPREELCNLFDNEMNERSIDVQITRLRKKIEDKTVKFIKTIRNKGYMFCV